MVLLFSEVLMRCYASGANDRDTAGGSGRKQGFIVLPFLLFLMVCSGLALCYGRSVLRETETAREFMCRKQLEIIAQSFVSVALQQENETELADAVYKLPSLQPGNDEVQVSVSVNRVSDLGLRFLKVDVSDSLLNSFILRQCMLLLPEDLHQQFVSSPVVVLSSDVQERSEEKNTSTITSKSDGVAFPQFSVEEIAIWTSTDLPSASELQRDGLNGWIYCSKGISLTEGLNVNGDGILAFAEDAAIGDNTVFTGRIIILANRDLRIGNRVKLEKALILCQGNLTVGSDSIINGAVMVQKNAKVDSKSKITGDREVLEPFKSMVSY